MTVQRVHEHHLDAKESGADLSGSEMLIAKLNSDGELVLCGDGEVAYGVIQEGKAEGLASTVATGGNPIRVIASGAITPGARVQCDASGKVKAGTTNSVGVCRDGVSADGEVAGITWDQGS